MAYSFRRDGETVIRFEKAKWDSFWGYQCPTCHWIITDPTYAMNHENAAPEGCRRPADARRDR